MGSGSRQVVVAVEPRLLADSLSHALGDNIAQIVRIDPGDSPPSEHADVALVTGDRSPQIEADLVIQLPEDPDDDAVVSTAEGDLQVRGSLDEILRIVRAHLQR